MLSCTRVKQTVPCRFQQARSIREKVDKTNWRKEVNCSIYNVTIVCYLWCRQPLCSWLSQAAYKTIFKRMATTEGGPPVVQPVPRSRQCSNCNKDMNLTDGLQRCSDCKIALGTVAYAQTFMYLFEGNG